MSYSNSISPDTISNSHSILKKEIERKFGQQIITAKECLQLAEDIYSRTSSLINFNTIRRFFGLVKTQYPASKATINIFCAYCGHATIENLLNSVNEAQQKTENKKDTILLNYLVLIFKSTNVNDDDDETFNSFVKITIEHLNKNVGLMKLLQKEIVKTKNGIEFYFEKNVNYDQLNSFYGDGLQDYINESPEAEKQVFALSLLCLKNWLMNDEKSLALNFEKVQKLTLPNNTPGFIWARYFSAILFHADSLQIDTEKILIETYAFHSTNKLKNGDTKVSQSFEFIYANALILTDNHEHALYYINHTLKSYKDLYTTEGNYCLQKLLLLKAIALSRQKNIAESKKIYQLLKPSKFYFLSARLDTALYLILTKEINKGNSKTEEQLNKIITESGFLKLKTMAAG